MRILCSRFAQEIGGAERSFFAHLSAYERLGHEVVAVTNLALPEGLEVGKEDVWWFRKQSKLYKLLVALPQLFQAAGLVRKYRIDVINPHSRFDHIVFSLSKPLHGRPVVWKDALEIHEHLDPKQNSLSRWIYLRALRSASAIYTLSEDHRQRLLAALPAWFAPEKVARVPSGLDFARYSLEAEPAITHDGLVLGYIARIHEQKGIQYLLSALPEVQREIPDVRLVVIGEGEYREELKSQARALGLESAVEFIDFADDVSPYMRSFDIFVCPSLYESWGISVHEARLFGLPIIASDVGALPEQVEDGVSGLLVPPADSEALAKAIINLGEDEGLRQKLGTNAAKSAQELGGFEDTVRVKLMPLLREAIREEE